VDALYLLLLVALFASAYGLVRGLDRLGKPS
jgi:hypothetical protein